MAKAIAPPPVSPDAVTLGQDGQGTQSDLLPVSLSREASINALARLLVAQGGHDPDAFYLGDRRWERALPEAERFYVAFLLLSEMLGLTNVK